MPLYTHSDEAKQGIAEAMVAFWQDRDKRAARIASLNDPLKSAKRRQPKSEATKQAMRDAWVIRRAKKEVPRG